VRPQAEPLGGCETVRRRTTEGSSGLRCRLVRSERFPNLNSRSRATSSAALGRNMRVDARQRVRACSLSASRHSALPTIGEDQQLLEAGRKNGMFAGPIAERKPRSGIIRGGATIISVIAKRCSKNF